MNTKTVPSGKREKIQPDIKKQTTYTDEEIEFIRRNYLKMTNEQLAAKLNGPVAGIATVISRLGLSGHPKRRKLMKEIRRKNSQI